MSEQVDSDTKQVNGSKAEPTLDELKQQWFHEFGQVFANSRMVPTPQGMRPNVDTLHTDIQVRLCICHVDILLDMIFASGLVNKDAFTKRLITTLQNHVHEITSSKPRIVVPK